MVNRSVAVLSSGGLDSAVMLSTLAQQQIVHPIYLRCGLFWEESELGFLHEFVHKLSQDRILQIQELSFSMKDVYGDQWYTRGEDIPGYYDPDLAWEIPGRNILLVTKTAIWCKLNRVDTLALGTLGSNPFGDATSDFFINMEGALRQGLDCSIKILRPLSAFSKADVIRLGRRLPLELTLSCANPVGKSHCGCCGKCRERIDAFSEAGVPDPTSYWDCTASRLG